MDRESEIEKKYENLLDKLAADWKHPERLGPEGHKKFGQGMQELMMLDRERQQARERSLVGSAILAAELAEKEQRLAERQLALKIAAAVNVGEPGINLSQEYETADKNLAARVHQEALTKISPLIEEAEKLGYKVDKGQAVAVGERMDISEKAGIRM